MVSCLTIRVLVCLRLFFCGLGQPRPLLLQLQQQLQQQALQQVLRRQPLQVPLQLQVPRVQQPAPVLQLPLRR